VGPFGGLEGGAYVARVDDPSAAWFNPAGLSRAKTAQITGSAGLYQFTTVAPSSLPNPGGALDQIPNLIGYSMNAFHDCTMGFAIVTNNAWNQETDSELTFGNAASGDVLDTPRMRSSPAAPESQWGLPERTMAILGREQSSRYEFAVVDAVSDRIANSAGLRTLLLASRKSGNSLQLRPVLGVHTIPRRGGTLAGDPHTCSDHSTEADSIQPMARSMLDLSPRDSRFSTTRPSSPTKCRGSFKSVWHTPAIAFKRIRCPATHGFAIVHPARKQQPARYL
jgi:hypothetical protein